MPNPILIKYSITYPKCDLKKEHVGEVLKTLDGVKAIVVAEEHHKDGDPHLHAFVQFDKKARRDTNIFDVDGHHGNVQGCRNIRDWIRYLTKEDKSPWTYEFDIEACLKKKCSTLSVARAATMSYEKLRTKIRPQDLQRTIAGIQLDKLLTAKLEDLEKPCGIWIHGLPGIGKSFDVRRYCREKGLGLYDKPHNKWWDGYSTEEVVIMDDVHPSDRSWITKFLKTWADAYPFKAETKGGSIMIRPKWLIVTSNFEIHEFAERMQDIEALHRRYTYFQAEKFDDTYIFLQETIGWVAIPATPPPSEPEIPSPSELDKFL
uniref:ATP-dependent helicase Rep n=1 Tax=unidentified TaxID=32644 RepID=A0A6G9W289_9ZZZZ|nr:replication associated protein [unidentified]